jgi:glycosyltransferase involved in cell wall biosynthesis
MMPVMETKPKVSVCIPAYNNATAFKIALESVLMQNYTNFEIVVTDDSDGSELECLLKKYNSNKIRYTKNEMRLGSPENWNRAVQFSKGEYIKILHHDDYLCRPDSLGKFVELLETNPKADLGFSATFAQTGETTGWMHQLTPAEVESISNNPLVLFENNMIGAPSTTIFRNSQFIGFDKHLKWNVDKEFYIRHLIKNRTLIYTSEQLVVTGIVPGRVTDLCIDNKEIQVYEYMYTLSGIAHLCSQPKYKKPYLKCVLCTIKVLNNYAIESLNDIRLCGFKGEIDKSISKYLRLKGVNFYLANAYLKWLRKKALS